MNKRTTCGKCKSLEISYGMVNCPFCCRYRTYLKYTNRAAITEVFKCDDCFFATKHNKLHKSKNITKEREIKQ